MSEDNSTVPLLGSSVQEDISKTSISKLNNKLIPLISMLSFFYTLNCTSVIYTGLQIKLDFDLNLFQYGLAVSLYFLPHCLSMLPTTLPFIIIIMKKFLATPMGLSSTTFLLAISHASFFYIQNKFQFFGLRFVSGIFSSVLICAIWHYLFKIYPQKYLKMAFRSYMNGSLWAFVLVASPLSAVLLGLDGLLGFKGWQWLFICQAGLMLLYGFVLGCTLPVDIDSIFCLNYEEQEYLKSLRFFELYSDFEDGSGQASVITHQSICEVLSFWFTKVFVTSTLLIFIGISGLIYFLTFISLNLLNKIDIVPDYTESCYFEISCTYPIIVTFIIIICGFLFLFIFNFLKIFCCCLNNILCVNLQYITGAVALTLWSQVFQDHFAISVTLCTIGLAALLNENIHVLKHVKDSEDAFNTIFKLHYVHRFLRNVGLVLGPIFFGFIMDYLGLSSAIFFVAILVFIAAFICIFLFFDDFSNMNYLCY